MMGGFFKKKKKLGKVTSSRIQFYFKNNSHDSYQGADIVYTAERCCVTVVPLVQLCIILAD